MEHFIWNPNKRFCFALPSAVLPVAFPARPRLMFPLLPALIPSPDLSFAPLPDAGGLLRQVFTPPTGPVVFPDLPAVPFLEVIALPHPVPVPSLPFTPPLLTPGVSARLPFSGQTRLLPAFPGQALTFKALSVLPAAGFAFQAQTPPALVFILPLARQVGLIPVRIIVLITGVFIKGIHGQATAKEKRRKQKKRHRAGTAGFAFFSHIPSLPGRGCVRRELIAPVGPAALPAGLSLQPVDYNY
jgi:hypothetical protein